MKKKFVDEKLTGQKTKSNQSQVDFQAITQSKISIELGPCVEGKGPHEHRAQVALVVKVVQRDGGRELHQVGQAQDSVQAKLFPEEEPREAGHEIVTPREKRVFGGRGTDSIDKKFLR